jgi:hypothetical protein
VPLRNLVAAPAAVLAVAATLAASGCARGAPPKPIAVPSGSARPSVAVPSAPATLSDPMTAKAADTLCAAENEQEMGTARLGRLYGARTSGYLTVQRLESQARRELRTALGKLPVPDGDRAVLSGLLADQDAMLNAREKLYGVLGRQPQNAKLSLLTGPHEVVDAYRGVVDAYLTGGRHFLAAGLPSCATPMITVMYGPGSDEASAATVEFRIAAACPTVRYTTDGTTGTNSAALGTVVQPGTHRSTDRYDGSAGPVTPPVQHDEVVVLTSDHFPVSSATCAG